MSTSSSKPGSGSALASLTAALSKLKVGTKALVDPVKSAAVELALEVTGLHTDIAEDRKEYHELLGTLDFLTTQVLDALPPEGTINDPATREAIETLKDRAVCSVKLALSSEGQEGEGNLIRLASRSLDTLRQKLDRQSMRFTLSVAARYINDGAFRPNISSDRARLNPPPKPAIFCGRDEILESLVELLLNDETCRLSLLGTGGIGKTSLAAAILHDERVTEKFDPNIFFLSCEALVSASGIVLALGLAMERLAEAKATLEKLGDRWSAGLCDQSIGDVLYILNRYGPAMRKYEEAKAAFAEYGDRRSTAYCNKRMGDVLCIVNRYSEGMEKFKEAEATFTSIGDRRNVVLCNQSMGDALRMLHRHPEAVEKLQKAKTTFQHIGDRRSAAECKRILNVLRMLRRDSDAMEMLEEAKETFDSLGDRRGAAQCDKSMGDVLHMLNRFVNAMEKFEEAKATFDSLGDRRYVALCDKTTTANILQKLGRSSEAIVKLGEAKATFDDIGDRRSGAQCKKTMGDVLHALYRYSGAMENFEEAKATFNDIGDRQSLSGGLG
ncbi:TPR-like protein [Calocera cornea HHB12733]|uniref:TPR-like protein n=1 Tax=Calocera cornea HHB12733 TaxID=1353952 RepID=A0A165C597_9BASI|nr:TPR-like protein [Calocera cornea HHB12733]